MGRMLPSGMRQLGCLVVALSSAAAAQQPVPIIERITRGANVPYFFSLGNHDVTTMPKGDPVREQ